MTKIKNSTMILRYFIIDFVYFIFCLSMFYIIVFRQQKKKETIGEEKKWKKRRG